MRKRLEIALDVAKALQYLHAEDLIHRDVKVQNVLVSELMPKRTLFMGTALFYGGCLSGFIFKKWVFQLWCAVYI